MREEQSTKQAIATARKNKRLDSLDLLEKMDPIGYHIRLTLKEAKHRAVVTSWDQFCDLKIKAYTTLWGARKGKPPVPTSTLIRRQQRMEKMRAMLAKMEAESGS